MAFMGEPRVSRSQSERLSLVGDADRGGLLVAGEDLAAGVEGGGPDFAGLVLDPALLRRKCCGNSR